MAKKKKFSGGGQSQRQLRVGEMIRRTLSELLMRGDVHDPDLNRMSITVSEVRVTPDLSIATAYVLPLGGKGKKEAIAALAENKGELRRLLAKEMTTKHTPDLRFQLDESFDRMEETARLLNQDVVRRDVAAMDGDDDGAS